MIGFKKGVFMIDIFFDENETEFMKNSRNTFANNMPNTLQKSSRISSLSPAINSYSNDLLCLQLHLDKGDLSCGIHSAERKDYIQSIYSKELQDTINIEKKIELMAQDGKHFRIWYSHMSYSICGFYFVCSILRKYQCTVSTVELTQWMRSKDLFYSWGQINEMSEKDILSLQKSIQKDQLNRLADEWIRLVSNKKKLRVCVNGRIQCVNDDFFDMIILAIMDCNEITIKCLLEEVSKEYPFIMDDYFCIFRVLYLIQHRYIRITEKNDNIYRVKIIKVQ